MRARRCASGRDALSALEAAKDRGRPYDLVLLDGHMPEVDGFEVAAELATKSGLAAATIMMITSIDRGGSIKRVRELGVSDYVVKPVQRAALATAIRGVRAQSDASKTMAEARGTDNGGGRGPGSEWAGFPGA